VHVLEGTTMSTPPDGDLRAHICALEARLERVEAVQAIYELKARYGALTDRRYGPEGVVPRARLERLAREVAQLFTDDGVWDGGEALGRCVGREAIERRFLEPTLDFAWHFFVKPRIDVDGDRANGTWDILAPCTGRDGRALWMAGVEHDRYRREQGRWLHSYMKLEVVFLCPYERGWARRRGASEH